MLIEPGHLWLAVGSAQQIRVAALKTSRTPPLGVGAQDAVFVMDAHFLFVDPRHAFPVFLLGDQSQILTDPALLPALPLQAASSITCEQLAHARAFVLALTAPSLPAQ